MNELLLLFVSREPCRSGFENLQRPRNGQYFHDTACFQGIGRISEFEIFDQNCKIDSKLAFCHFVYHEKNSILPFTDNAEK